jgi:hypothetical protein
MKSFYDGVLGVAWKPVFDDAVTVAQKYYDSIEDKESDAGKAAKIMLDAAKKAADSSNLFTQDQVNEYLKKDKVKHQLAHQKTLDELEALQKKAGLTGTEKADLEKQIEETRKLLETKEATTEEQMAKLTKGHAKEVGTLTERKDLWKKRYTTSTVTNSLTQAAVKHKAGNPAQVIAILQPLTTLTEELDKKGKPTGDLVPMTTWKDKDEKGAPVTLTLAPSDVVKRMSEMDEHMNLFDAEGTGGQGKFRRQAAGDLDVREIAKDTEAYRKARKDGTIK